MSQGYLYLIGGGEIAKGETITIDDDIKKNLKKGSPLVFFGTAAGDSDGYAQTIQSVFGDTVTVVAATEEKGRAFAVDAINSASGVYLGGGNTDLLLNLFERWELVDVLREAYQNGLLIAGMSAGAQALSAWYVDEDHGQVELRRGWGLVPACVLVHAKLETAEQVKMLWENDADARKYDFIVIGERSAWRIGTDQGQKIGSGELWQYKGAGSDSF